MKSLKQQLHLLRLNSLPRTEAWKKNISIHVKNGKNYNCSTCGKELYRRGGYVFIKTYCSYKCLGLSKKGRFLSKEHIEKIAKASSSRPICQEAREKTMGENHWNWKGGVTKLPGYGSLKVKNRRARKLGAEGTHSILEWESLKIKYGFMCLCCKRMEPEIKLTEDHIIPLYHGGSNLIENIQPLCNSCNSKKSVKIINYIHV